MRFMPLGRAGLGSSLPIGDAISLEVSDNQAVAALDPDDLKTHWKRVDLRDCDALALSACVQMRSLEAIEEVEQASGLPTLSAATATTWAILRALELEPVAPGAGAAPCRRAQSRRSAGILTAALRDG
jgi:maleate isomerase